MKNYRVIVNGSEYEIGIEEIDASEAKQAASAPVAAPAPASQPAHAGDGETVSSPMPGTILAVNVQNGSSVKKGDVLVVLEAMKMENEIMAPCDGQVTFVIAKGTSVNTGETLCQIK